MPIEVQTRKWGNSIGIIIPKEVVEKEKIKENQRIIVNIVKEADLSDIFGMIKKRKMSAQKMKDLSRKEWER
ncbi:AbrB/MazE/SpoVT family DNA-binding domain-containing protein [Candidatus Pacearchaeota archaeon]|nr:AbrB/MazE/SpoVT family DNA-binding domain-containing protein [Candidatus Pacearchaeota archaeon]